jgi:hypothetical protein
MSIDFFLVPNTLASQKGYIAQTVRGPTVGGEALIRRMAEANTTLSTPDIRAVLSLLEEKVMGLLLDGHRVEIGDMLRLTPVVSGVLEGKDLRKAVNQPGARVTCRLLPGFARRFGKAARLVRRRATRRRPSLYTLAGAPGEREGLHAVYPNTLRGHHLKIQGLALSGLILAGTKAGERIAVPVSSLSVQRHTNYELVFHFPSRFTPPAWLSDGAALSVKLEFRKERGGSVVESGFLRSVWRGRE